jgi:SAM-dependent methyltransferase
VPQAGDANAVKVRRVMQITRDLGGRPVADLRILDLGCGEGVYAIEAGIHGADVVAVDARTQRMDHGADVAARHGLTGVRFVRDDVRRVSAASYGMFDVVYLLGIVYHLDAPEVFTFLENVHALCARLLIVDTFVSLAPDLQAAWRDEVFDGERRREHDDDDPPEVRESRVLRSIDNTFSFRFTTESLIRALRLAGFTSVVECHVPAEPGKPNDRVTLAAIKGEPVALSAYPWINTASEAEIAERLRPDA